MGFFRSSVLVLGLVLVLPYEAIAWGPQGHEYAGAIADQLLTANARAQVKTILGLDLRVASTWTDCVKDVVRTRGIFHYRPDPRYHAACAVYETPEGISRMEDYVRRNWDNCQRGPKDDVCHKQYHYADVAIQHDHYDRAFTGTSDHDIVSALQAAIAVLQDKPVPAPFSIKDKREALFLLAHLVGDVHQPLHVGAVYLDAHDHLINPDGPGKKLDPATETRGGNSIDVGSTNLHAQWDGISKALKPLNVSPAAIAKAKAIKQSPGAVDAWPAAWASDTVIASHTAFRGITYSHPGTKGHWAAHFSDRTKYLAMKRRVQSDQLIKAGARLAQLLNELWPY